MRNLTLRQLRAVRAVMRHRKIAAAAAQVGLTASAVTLQIKEVEKELGLALFDRTKDGVHPTTAGLAVVEAVRAIDARLDELADDIDAIKGLRKGALRLGVVSTAKYFAPRMMAAFMKLYPGIEMQLSVGNRAEIITALETRSIDLALMGRPPRGAPMRAVVIGDHPLVIIAPPDHALVGQAAISKDRIAQEHFLVREAGSGTRTSLEIYFADIPGRLDSLGTEMGSNETIKQAVMAGLGIAFISAHTIEQEIELERLVILDVVGLPVHRQWFSVSRSDRKLSHALGAFQEFLKAKAPRLLPGLPAPTRVTHLASHN
jgi:LysR family transcriptional regulator, low CO2-responsive transcriptional regulator